MRINETAVLPLTKGGALIARLFIEGKLQEIEVPYYPLYVVGLFECAKYVRLAARQMFGKIFTRCSAWDRRYHDVLVANVTRPLEFYEQQDQLQRGMVVGFYNPDSNYKDETDERGEPRRYTHNVLYIGRSLQEKLLFAHQYGAETSIQTCNSLLRDGLIPIEILDARSNDR